MESGYDLKSFLPMVLSSAASFASMLENRSQASGALTVHPSFAAVKLRLGERDAAADPERVKASFIVFKESTMSKFDGIDIFSGIHFMGQTLLMDIGDELLLVFANEAAQDYRHSLPERIALAKGGAAPDEEASAYARCRLYAVIKTANLAHDPASKDALFRCLCLFSAEAIGLKGAYSSAVRAALAACERGILGKVDSAAMAAALLYAEGPQILKN